MEKRFRLGWSKGTYYSLAIGSVLELSLALATAFVGLFYFTLGIVSFIILMVWFQLLTVKKSCYLIDTEEIVFKPFCKKKRKFLIEKINRIEYVDYGTDWLRTVPNARYQLAIYFDRQYLKSVEPISFGPENRDEFVKSLLERKPDIVVENDENIIRRRFS